MRVFVECGYIHVSLCRSKSFKNLIRGWDFVSYIMCMYMTICKPHFILKYKHIPWNIQYMYLCISIFHFCQVLLSSLHFFNFKVFHQNDTHVQIQGSNIFAGILFYRLCCVKPACTLYEHDFEYLCTKIQPDADINTKIHL